MSYQVWCEYCGNSFQMWGTGEDWRCPICGNDTFSSTDDDDDQRIVWDRDSDDEYRGDDVEVGA